MCENDPRCEAGTPKGKRYLAARQEQISKGMIQVHVTFSGENGEGVGGETLWAYPIGKQYAQIANCAFFAPDIGMDDIVETEVTDNPMREFVQVVKKNTNTFLLKYNADGNEKAVKNDFIAIKKHFRHRGIYVEGATAGIVAISVPVMIENKETREIIAACPVKVEEMNPALNTD